MTVAVADSEVPELMDRGGVDFGRVVGGWFGLGVLSVLLERVEVRPPGMPGVLCVAAVVLARVLIERSMLFRRPWGAPVDDPPAEFDILLLILDA